MHKMIAWFIHNSVAANLMMMILVAGGLLALPLIHQEEFPTLDVDAVQITVPYLGAAPEEVEAAVCIRVEEAIEGTEGIDKVTSQASEGFCSVSVEHAAAVCRIGLQVLSLAEAGEGRCRLDLTDELRSVPSRSDCRPLHRLRRPTG